MIVFTPDNQLPDLEALASRGQQSKGGLPGVDGRPEFQGAAKATMGDPKSRTGKVTLYFPRSADGKKRTEHLMEKLSGVAVEVFRVLLPIEMTVSSFATSSAAPSEALVTLVRQAEWIGGVRTVSPSPAASVIESSRTGADHSSRAAVGHTSQAPTPMGDPSATIAVTPTTTGDITTDLGDRRWRIRGLASNLSYERLRVHLFVSRETKDSRMSGFFVDTIELHSARQRTAFVEQASEELGLEGEIVKRDLGHVLLRLEAFQDEQIRASLQPKTPIPTMTETEREAAMDLLRDPKLVDRVLADIDRVGIVGESSNKLIAYLAEVRIQRARQRHEDD